MPRAAAKRASRAELKRIPLVCGDALLLPFKEAVFDGIFMSFTLELFDDEQIQVVLGEARRADPSSSKNAW